MRTLGIMLVVWLSAATAGLCAGGVGGQRSGGVIIGGRTYVGMADWARASGFDVRWLKRDEAVTMTNRYWRMAFTKDSRTFSLNGVEVALSYPAVMQNGAVFLARTDIDTALMPVLAPPKDPLGARVRNITIDPGHGGKDPGFQSGPYQEKKYALLLALELRDQLKRAGFNVSLTRTTDKAVDLRERPVIAQGQRADLFISLHWNSVTAGKGEVAGPQTYCLTPAGAPSSSDSREDVMDAATRPGNRNDSKNMFLAYMLQRSLINGLGTEDHSVRRARYAVLVGAEMPAVLIEGGYMSNPAELKKIVDAGWRKQMAGAIVQGILGYQRQVETPMPATATARVDSPGRRGGGGR